MVCQFDMGHAKSLFVSTFQIAFTAKMPKAQTNTFLKSFAFAMLKSRFWENKLKSKKLT
jgi:hypothetical protein